MIGSAVGERVLVAPGWCPTGHEGSVKTLYAGAVQRGRERGITVNNVQPGDRHGFESRPGDWAVRRGRHRLGPLRARYDMVARWWRFRRPDPRIDRGGILPSMAA